MWESIYFIMIFEQISAFLRDGYKFDRVCYCKRFWFKIIIDKLCVVKIAILCWVFYIVFKNYRGVGSYC